MKKLSNTINNSNKLMLSYLFLPVFINLYFKTKHSNERFDLGFYSLSNVFSYRKHISSKSYISVLTISGKGRNLKIIAPSPPPLPPRPFYYHLPPFYGIVSIFAEGHFIMTPLPFSDIFPKQPPPHPAAHSTPLQ